MTRAMADMSTDPVITNSRAKEAGAIIGRHGLSGAY
jgi:hypothetical protein